jgi:hypothetical protein
MENEIKNTAAGKKCRMAKCEAYISYFSRLKHLLRICIILK